MTTQTTTTLVRQPDDGEATYFFNALMTTKASMAETGGAYSLTEHLVTAASNPPMHVQVDEDEAFYVLEGEVEFVFADHTVTAGPGTLVAAPLDVLHGFRTRGPGRARMLNIHAPGAGFAQAVRGQK
jgi:mannose-6-phosphate isomerase-like protein (cupin superfamily)